MAQKLKASVFRWKCQRVAAISTVILLVLVAFGTDHTRNRYRHRVDDSARVVAVAVPDHALDLGDVVAAAVVTDHTEPNTV